MHPRNGLRIAPSLYANSPIPVQLNNYLLCGEFLYRLDRLVEENGGDNVTEFVKRNMKFLFTHELAKAVQSVGQRNKHAFKLLELFNVMYGKYSLYNSFILGERL